MHSTPYWGSFQTEKNVETCFGSNHVHSVHHTKSVICVTDRCEEAELIAERRAMQVTDPPRLPCSPERNLLHKGSCLCAVVAPDIAHVLVLRDYCGWQQTGEIVANQIWGGLVSARKQD
jgi:hypothetical protein